MMRRRLHSAVLLAAVGVLATGCGGGTPTPPPLAATSGAASTTAPSGPTASGNADPSAGAATPSPSAATSSGAGSPGASLSPTATAAGTGSDRSAADTVLTGFLGGLDEAATAKSSAALKPLYVASCLWCAEQTKSIDLAAFLDGKRTGGVVSGTSVTYRGVGRARQLVFDVTMSVTAMKVVDSTGRQQMSSPAVTRGAFTFGVAKTGNTWVVVDGIRGRTSL